MLTAGPRGQFPRWRRSRKRFSVCSVLRCPDLWLQCSVSFVHGLEKTHLAAASFLNLNLTMLDKNKNSNTKLQKALLRKCQMARHWMSANSYTCLHFHVDQNCSLLMSSTRILVDCINVITTERCQIHDDVMELKETWNNRYQYNESDAYGGQNVW